MCPHALFLQARSHIITESSQVFHTPPIELRIKEGHMQLIVLILYTTIGTSCYSKQSQTKSPHVIILIFLKVSWSKIHWSIYPS